MLATAARGFGTSKSAQRAVEVATTSWAAKRFPLNPTADDVRLFARRKRFETLAGTGRAALVAEDIPFATGETYYLDGGQAISN